MVAAPDVHGGLFSYSFIYIYIPPRVQVECLL